MKHGKKMIKVLFLLLVILGGIAAALYTQAIPEAAKLLLLGVVLIGAAQWGRRQMKGVGDTRRAHSDMRIALKVESQ